MKEAEILVLLKERFQKNMQRHNSLNWDDVEDKLLNNNEKLKVLIRMEETGGEPDVIGVDSRTGEFIFCDCSRESPKARFNTCYDQEGENQRIKKKIYPKGNALSMAKDIGIELLTEDDYFYLQTLGEFDTKTSSWLRTPDDIRKKGGAIYGDHRFGRTFIYHNGAQSFYSSRGFRGTIKI